MNIPDHHMALIYTDPGEFTFLLGVVPTQPKTQALTRSILNRYPEISGGNWIWKKGDGLSCGTERIFYTAKPDEFDIPPSYPGIEPILNVQGARDAGYRSNLNPLKKGIEIRFTEKPPEDVIESLKAHGFRWSGKVKCWYARQSPTTIGFAEKMRV